MEKTLLVGMFLLAFFLTTGMASARGFGFGLILPPVVIGPPIISVSPPAYYPYPYGYYGPGYYGGYYGPGYYGYHRVPRYWDRAWTYHGWHHGSYPRHWGYRH